MQGDEIRQRFLDFFKKKGHLYRPSAPLAVEDPDLLFTIAGMVPFKAFFLGLETPPASRITSCQLCFRTNDLERVGETSYHHTFFEMLGNFSFGDYFKKEACEWGLEFVTKELDIDLGRLWITIFEDDEQTFSIWRKLGIPAERIKKRGAEDNFWAAAEVGPCGPDTEIFFDRGEKMGCKNRICQPGCNYCSRWVELWNLVFMQYNKDESGKLTPLPSQNVDTGMGLERVATVLQNAADDYHTDLFFPVYRWIKNISPLEKQDEKSLRVISDHLRGLVFLLAEGILPSNTGRGYVVRRVLRRAFRYGRKLGLTRPFLYTGVPIVIKMMEKPYPHLKEKEEKITQWIKGEEESFQDTLVRGLSILENLISQCKMRGKKTIPGKDIFKMYDTYGFPLELTREIAFEEGLNVDEEGFLSLMQRQREKSRMVSGKKEIVFASSSTLPFLKELERKYFTEKKQIFVGYEKSFATTILLAIIRNSKLVQQVREGEEVDFIFSPTPFYPQGGGQVGDTGKVLSGQNEAVVVDTQKKGALILHKVRIVRGTFKQGDRIEAQVNTKRREAIARSHTATHLLQAALRRILGDEVKQSGSLVEDDRLRFDFTFPSGIGEEVLKKVCLMVNEKVRENLPVKVEKISLEEARKRGALALFEEKYEDEVRMVEIGDFSREVCGGTHLSHTGRMGIFQIVSESGIAAGVRRIEAITGERALSWLMDKKDTLQKLARALEVSEEEVLDKFKEREREISYLKDKLQKLQRIYIEVTIKDLIKKAIQIENIKVCTAELKEISPPALRDLAERTRDKLGEAVVGLACTDKGKAFIVVTSSLKELSANRLIKEIASLAQGSGGGRWDFAQGGTSHPNKVSQALQRLPEIIRRIIAGS